MGIVQWLTGTRAHGAIIDANAFAALTNLFYFSALFVYLRKDHWRSRQRYLFLAALALLQLAFFATLSRGGLLVFMVLLPISLWIARGTPGRFPARLSDRLVRGCGSFRRGPPAPARPHARLDTSGA